MSVLKRCPVRSTIVGCFLGSLFMLSDFSLSIAGLKEMASEIAPRVKELAAKPDDLSFTLGPRGGERENGLQKFLP